jgi:hypothetical protein
VGTGTIETGLRERAAAPASGVEGAVPPAETPAALPGAEGAQPGQGTQTPVGQESQQGSPAEPGPR